jgi:hypothetical protein
MSSKTVKIENKHPHARANDGGGGMMIRLTLTGYQEKLEIYYLLIANTQSIRRGEATGPGLSFAT